MVFDELEELVVALIDFDFARDPAFELALANVVKLVEFVLVLSFCFLRHDHCFSVDFFGFFGVRHLAVGLVDEVSLVAVVHFRESICVLRVELPFVAAEV